MFLKVFRGSRIRRWSGIVLSLSLLLLCLCLSSGPVQAATHAQGVQQGAVISPVGGTWTSNVTFFSGLQKGQNSTSYLTFLVNGSLTATTVGLPGQAKGYWSVVDPTTNTIHYQFDEELGNGQYIEAEQTGLLLNTTTLITVGSGTLLQSNGLPVILPGQSEPTAASQSNAFSTREA